MALANKRKSMLDNRDAVHVVDEELDEPRLPKVKKRTKELSQQKRTNKSIIEESFPMLKPKMKQLELKLREKYSQSIIQKLKKEPPTQELKQDFDRKLMNRREMIYREYNLDKLWHETAKTQIKNCLDFADSDDIEDAKLRFQDWLDDQKKL